MNKRVIAALAAVVLAVAGVAALLSYARGAEDRAFDGASLVSVLQVKEAVPADTAAADLGGRIESVELPKAAVARGAVTDLSALEGLSTTVALEPGEQVLLSRFAEGGAVVEKPSPSAIPDGMQALTIPVDVARAVGGTLKVGDPFGAERHGRLVAELEARPPVRVVAGGHLDSGDPSEEVLGEIHGRCGRELSDE